MEMVRMTDYHAEHVRNAAARGLRPSQAVACSRVVAGRRCQAYHPEPQQCICVTQKVGLLPGPGMWQPETFVVAVRQGDSNECAS